MDLDGRREALKSVSGSCFESQKRRRECYWGVSRFLADWLAMFINGEFASTGPTRSVYSKSIGVVELRCPRDAYMVGMEAQFFVRS